MDVDVDNGGDTSDPPVTMADKLFNSSSPLTDIMDLDATPLDDPPPTPLHRQFIASLAMDGPNAQNLAEMLEPDGPLVLTGEHTYPVPPFSSHPPQITPGEAL
jgi:hypothetical protein